MNYGPETTVALGNAREIRCPAHPTECDYVRLLDHGNEIAYWSISELNCGNDSAAMDALGAIMGAIKSVANP